MNKEHYSEADLLETYYVQPGLSMPVMLHLAKCSDCALKYERLERKLREAAACPADREETFWARQRVAIMRRIGERRLAVTPALRIAAAAVLALVLGATVVYRTTVRQPQQDATVANLPDVQQVDEPQVPSDPWQSDELKEFHAVVQWESWIAEPTKTKGDRSL